MPSKSLSSISDLKDTTELNRMLSQKSSSQVLVHYMYNLMVHNIYFVSQNSISRSQVRPGIEIEPGSLEILQSILCLWNRVCMKYIFFGLFITLRCAKEGREISFIYHIEMC